MARRVLCSVLVVFALTGLTLAADPALYGQSIVVTSTHKQVADTVNELAEWLKRCTGATFTTGADLQPDAPAILLVEADSPLAPAEDVARLKDRGVEAFSIRSEGKNRLWIVGNSRLALQHGAYFYLHQLGCRWFLPNEHWKIAPALKSVAIDIDRVEEPAYRYRNLNGTGGFGGNLALDPKRGKQALWEQKWKPFLLLGGEMPLSGHTGEAFNTAHKKVLTEHPEYLAEIDGKRRPWHVTTKLCASNPAVSKLYIDWTLMRFKRVYDRDPKNPRAWGVSVEPADGDGQCECAQCNKIGNGSSTDKVFFLANEAAKALDAAYPGKKASLLAYNDHAAVPSIALEPNIAVWVTPYGFNRTGLSGDDLLAAWSQKCKLLGVYDYWSIPDWSNDQPTLDYRHAVPDKLRKWRENSVVAFCGESTSAAGNIGIVWYLASRLMWNPDADVDAILDEFYRLSFGPAAEPMKRMLERWSAGFLMSDHELALSFRDLEEARRLATDDAVRARVDDFVLYVQYLRLWHDYGARGRQGPLPKDPAAKQDEQDRRNAQHAEATDALLRYLWRIYDSSMVHSYRMAVLVMRRYERGDVSKALIEKWPIYKPQAPIWQEITPVTNAEVARFVEEGVRDFTPLDFEARAYSDDFVPLSPIDKTWTPSAKSVTSPPVSSQEYLFWAPEGVPTIGIEFLARKVYDSTITVTVYDPNAKVVFRRVVPALTPWQTFSIPTKTSGLYRMSVFDPKVTHQVRVPANLPFVMKGGFMSSDLSPRTYFYVPKGLKAWALYAEGAIPFNVFMPNGEKMDETINRFSVTQVPAGMDGSVWAINGFKSWQPLRPINFPKAFALSPDGMLVPREVLK